MNILLVGNGFDLAHGLPTGYRDFAKFLKALKALDEVASDSQGYTELIDSLDFNPSIKQFLSDSSVLETDSRIKELRELAKDNLWVYRFATPSTEYLKNGWVDFEHEISSVIQKLDRFSRTMDVSERQSIVGSLFLSSYYGRKETLIMLTQDQAKIIKRLEHDLKGLIRLLEIYLCLCLEIVDYKKKLLSVSQIGTIDKILSFNYTDTYNRVYRLPKRPIPECCYIHGKANEENTIEVDNIVLGIDEYLDEVERNKQLDYIRFKKYFQRIYKNTDYNYIEWFRYPGEKYLHIIGHSLDVTDRDVLQYVLTCEGVNTMIYYHSPETNAKQIINLVKILGYDKVNELTRGMGKSSISFCPLFGAYTN